MTGPRLTDRLGAGALFVGICMVLLTLRLMPLPQGPGGWPGPDLMLALTMVWVQRRPDALPVGLIAAAFLAADLLLMRPPGLWTALVVVATEGVRQTARHGQQVPLWLETAIFAGLQSAMIMLAWLVLSVTFVSQPSLGPQLLQVPVTVAAYPLVALAFGLAHRPQPTSGWLR